MGTTAWKTWKGLWTLLNYLSRIGAACLLIAGLSGAFIVLARLSGSFNAIGGGLGALAMLVSGLAALALLCLGRPRLAVGFASLAIAAFVVRSSVSTFFNDTAVFAPGTAVYRDLRFSRSASVYRRVLETMADVEESPLAAPAAQRAADFNTEEYRHIAEQDWVRAKDEPLSTFSIDVDTASYSNIRRFLSAGQLPPADAVRIEEMVIYFSYAYPAPEGEDPVSIITEVSAAPWRQEHRLLLIGLRAREIPPEQIPASNLVFLVDVSGSMNDPEKLPLVKNALTLLTDKLRPSDRVAIVVYAGNAGLVLPSTAGENKNRILNAIKGLEAGGSTAGGEGIRLAYATARENFIAGGNNRVILATDGDFNVGVSSEGELVRIIEREREDGVFLTVLGFGTGNYKDGKMEQLADKGNGNFAYIDSLGEARKVLVDGFGGTLLPVAKDVKIQVEFNPAHVAAYRLIGYENRALTAQDFNNDKKDAGEMGSGHTVTALYELLPPDAREHVSSVDPLKYQEQPAAKTGFEGELLTIKLRYKAVDDAASRLMTKVVPREPGLAPTSPDFRFAAAVAEFGMLLRESPFKGEASYRQVLELAGGAAGQDGHRKEFLSLVTLAQSAQHRGQR